jgi:hypothetical protein
MEKLGLKVKTVAGAHSPRLLTIDEFNAALERYTRVAQQ